MQESFWIKHIESFVQSKFELDLCFRLRYTDNGIKKPSEKPLSWIGCKERAAQRRSVPKYVTRASSAMTPQTARLRAFQTVSKRQVVKDDL